MAPVKHFLTVLFLFSFSFAFSIDYVLLPDGLKISDMKKKNLEFIKILANGSDYMVVDDINGSGIRKNILPNMTKFCLMEDEHDICVVQNPYSGKKIDKAKVRFVNDRLYGSFFGVKPKMVVMNDEYGFIFITLSKKPLKKIGLKNVKALKAVPKLVDEFVRRSGVFYKKVYVFVNLGKEGKDVANMVKMFSYLDLPNGVFRKKDGKIAYEYVTSVFGKYKPKKISVRYKSRVGNIFPVNIVLY